MSRAPGSGPGSAPAMKATPILGEIIETLTEAAEQQRALARYFAMAAVQDQFTMAAFQMMQESAAHLERLERRIVDECMSAAP